MELQEVGKYSVEPFALERVLELEFVKKSMNTQGFMCAVCSKKGKKTA